MKRLKIKFSIVFCFSIFFFLPSMAQWKTEGWFKSAPYGQSLLSDMHPDFVRIDVSSISLDKQYNYGDKSGNRAIHTFANFGLNLPLWTGKSNDGRSGFSVTFPVCANIWMDLFEKATSPIVTTDYRISFPTLTFFHKTEKGFLDNYSIYFAPFRHESTHIGDEMVLKRKTDEMAIYRVNVSYNYIELRFTINEPVNRATRCHTLRGGVMASVLGNWYSIEERDGDIYQVPDAERHTETNPAGYKVARGPKNKFLEFYLQYQYQTPSSKKSGIQGLASIEYRNRALYGYDLSAMKGAPKNPATSDSRANTINAFIGIRCNGPGINKSYLNHFSAGIRAYFGNCPYGQFRSINGFSQIGLCLIFE